MKPSSTAFVLVKALGLYCLIMGAIHIVNAVCVVVFSTLLYPVVSAGPGGIPHHVQINTLLSTLCNSLPYGLVFCAAGLWLLAKTAYVVRVLLKIDDKA